MEHLRLAGKLIPGLPGGIACSIYSAPISICYAGGLALHIWATYLIHKHLGTFWAVLGFFTPPFAELPVLVACFWWGVWFYVLAVACWVASAVGVGLAEEMGTSPKVSVVPLLLVLGLGGSFAYFAIDHATSPQAMTEERVRELDDVAAAICGVLIASTSGDPLDAANLPDAKASLRKTLRRYDERSLRIVRDKVDCYLRFTAYVMDDLTAHIAGRNRSTPFALSERTRGAVASLPTAVRAAAGPEQIGLLEKQVSEAFRNQQGDLRSDWRELMATFQDAQWRIHAQVYEDLFGSPPPSLAELTRK